MENEPVMKIALCEVTSIVLRPNTPYVFEAIPGCKRCRVLLDSANEAYSHIGKSFDFTDPKTSVLPIYATTHPSVVTSEKKAKSKKKVPAPTS